MYVQLATKHTKIVQVVDKLNKNIKYKIQEKYNLIRMWANAQRDGRLAEYRWRPLLNAAKFG